MPKPTTGQQLAELYLEQTGLDPYNAAEALALLDAAERGDPVADLDQLSESELGEWGRAHERIDALCTVIRMVTRPQYFKASTGEVIDLADMNYPPEDVAAVRALVAKAAVPPELLVGHVADYEGLVAQLPGGQKAQATIATLTERVRMTPEQTAETVGRLLTTPDGTRHPDPQTWLAGRGSGRDLFLFQLALERLAREAAEQKARELARQLEEAQERADVAERQRRIPKTIRLGVAGYNALSRTRRMVEDLVERKEITLTAQHEKQVQTWDPSGIPLKAREVLIGLLGLLTQSGLMPDLSPYAPPPPDYVLVPVPGGFSEIADACGYERTARGKYGEKHESSTTRRVREGLNWLTEEAQHFFHIWQEYDPRTKRQKTRYAYAKAAIAQLYSEGEVTTRAGAQADLFLSPYAQFVALHPYALLGARVAYHEMPGDVLPRYRQALQALAEEARTNREVRKLVGRSPRPITSDVEFFLWAYMHGGRSEYRIGDDKLMERIGLQNYLDQRKGTEAERRLRRAVLVAQRMGALADRKETRNGVPVYLFPGERREEPAGLIGGTLELPLEVEA